MNIRALPIYLALIIAGTALGLLVLPPRLTPEAKHQALNLNLVEDQLPVVQDYLSTDNDFTDLKAHSYTGHNGSIRIWGSVDSENIELKLRRGIDDLELSVAVVYELSAEEDSP